VKLNAATRLILKQSKSLESFHIQSDTALMKTILMILFLNFMSLAQQPLDSHVDYGVKETQKLLVNPEQRKQTFEDPNANKANQDLQKLTGGDVVIDQEIWELTAELVPMLAGEGNGDPAQMVKFLDDMKRNPTSFAGKFTPEQRAKLKAIAEKIQKAKAKP